MSGLPAFAEISCQQDMFAWGPWQTFYRDSCERLLSAASQPVGSESRGNQPLDDGSRRKQPLSDRMSQWHGAAMSRDLAAYGYYDFSFVTTFREVLERVR
ncbi:MAG: hypothetical protein ACE5FV_13945, partial [Woeseia sp.]